MGGSIRYTPLAGDGTRQTEIATHERGAEGVGSAESVNIDRAVNMRICGALTRLMAVLVLPFRRTSRSHFAPTTSRLQDGHRLSAYEQNTQQSPSRGLSSVPQPKHL